jgi:hypothetical protein
VTDARFVSATELDVAVPANQGPGHIRAVRGKTEGNAVPINLYPPEEQKKE